MNRFDVNHQIAEQEGICNGQAHLMGTRVLVQDVLTLYDQCGFTDIDIAKQYQITVSQVHICLAYGYAFMRTAEGDYPEDMHSTRSSTDESNDSGMIKIPVFEQVPRLPNHLSQTGS